ncbi:MAG TPA: sulfite exporter TauE/SafE family protein, partial [Negativicutes bacterium]
GFDMSSALKGEVSYFLLLAIGFFTSLHCIGMCGGILMSQSISTQAAGKSLAFWRSLSYNGGRVLGYTALGGIVGAIGSVISVSIGFMSGIAIFAGIFMILMGLNMAGFGIVRRIMTISLPTHSLALKSKTPFVVGLFNGLMPCGPLQTMQLYALGTGSALAGATAMFIFAIGTLPLMLSFGAVTGIMSKDSTKRILKCSGVFIIILGIIMANRGLAIAGFQVPFSNFIVQNTGSAGRAVKAEINNGVQTIQMTANNQGYVPNVLYVQKGIPVQWVINGEQINSCNNQIIMPAIHIKKKLTSGENIIEFIPQGEDLNFSCWMGMISGIIKVVDDLSVVNTSEQQVVVPSGSGCCNTAGRSQCCGNVEQRNSIYGDDLEKAPTERLLQKAVTTKSYQTVTIKGIGYELDPLISIINKEMKTTVTLDLTKLDKPEGNWEIVDYNQKKVIYTFDGQQKVYGIELNNKLPGTLGIYKDKNITGIIEVVDDLNEANLEKIRAKFF